TGPKAGGPLYLGRLLATRPNRLPDWACEQSGWPREQSLPGPTGESNTYSLAPRGQVLCSAITATGVEAQWSALKQTGNRAVWLDHPCLRQWLGQGHIATNDQLVVSGEHPERDAGAMRCDVALFEGDADALQAFCARLALRTGPLVTVQGRSTDALLAGNGYMLDRLLSERSISVNTAAAGGNASLMTIG
ncbi:MAG: trifunctional transcriptional regulator/proline dehydrogenase/L-glutamate gamma-semialdehyde dehydrogenase, partial [Burkholderiales bacterium]